MDDIYLEVLAVQPLYSSDSTQGKCEAISTGSCTVCLTSESLGGGRAGALSKAGRGCRKAHVGLREVKLASIMPSSSMVFVALSSVGWRYGQFGIDLVEGCLG